MIAMFICVYRLDLLRLRIYWQAKSVQLRPSRKLFEALVGSHGTAQSWQQALGWLLQARGPTILHPFLCVFHAFFHRFLLILSLCSSFFCMFHACLQLFGSRPPAFQALRGTRRACAWLKESFFGMTLDAPLREEPFRQV